MRSRVGKKNQTHIASKKKKPETKGRKWNLCADVICCCVISLRWQEMRLLRSVVFIRSVLADVLSPPGG